MLRWSFPVWTPDASLDPQDLKSDRPKRKKKDEDAQPQFDRESFAETFLTDEPQSRSTIIETAVDLGLSGCHWRLASAAKTVRCAGTKDRGTGRMPVAPNVRPCSGCSIPDRTSATGKSPSGAACPTRS